MVPALQNYLDVPLDGLKRSFPWNDYGAAYESIRVLAEREWGVWGNGRFSKSTDTL